MAMAAVEEQTEAVRETHRCPHCGELMNKWAVPQGPWPTWDNEFMYICFNDECPYLKRNKEFNYTQGRPGLTYRQMYDPDRNYLQPIPIISLKALRDGIIE